MLKCLHSDDASSNSNFLGCRILMLNFIIRSSMVKLSGSVIADMEASYVSLGDFNYMLASG